MSGDKDVTPGTGDTDEKIRATVVESVPKRVAEVVETLKVAVTKGTDSGVSHGTTSKSGVGKYHFLLKGMASCHVDTHHAYKLKGQENKQGSSGIGK